MQMGFNNDVEYRGVTVHIQTEDLGLAVSKIMTQVFYSGAILEAKTISYAADIEALDDAPARADRIRKLMRALHKQAYKRMQDGTYDRKLEALAGDRLKPAKPDSSAPAPPSGARPPQTTQEMVTAPPPKVTAPTRPSTAATPVTRPTTDQHAIGAPPRERAFRGVDGQDALALGRALLQALNTEAKAG